MLAHNYSKNMQAGGTLRENDSINRILLCQQELSKMSCRTFNPDCFHIVFDASDTVG